VDDEPRILSALRRMLRREGYEIATAGSAREALALLESQAVDLVLSDHRMPGTSGVELLCEVRRRWPATARMLLSGWVEEIPGGELAAADVACVHSKPWDDEQLKQAIRQALSTR